MRRKPYIECPLCHAHLDPGERCDCEDEKEQRKKIAEKLFKPERETGQFVFGFLADERG